MSGSLARAKVPRLADVVFDELVGDILGGGITAGDALPPERVLAERFGVSRLIVRQAIHRLADIGVVRSRQGGATVVLGREEADALALLPHQYRLGDPQDERLVDSIEHQYTNGLSLIDIADRRANAESRQRIRDLVKSWQGDPNDTAAVNELNHLFWLAVADAGGNRIAIAQLRWWYESFADLDELTWVTVGVTGSERWELFQELSRRLCERDDALGYFKATAGPVVDRIIQDVARNAALRRGGATS